MNFELGLEKLDKFQVFPNFFFIFLLNQLTDFSNSRNFFNKAISGKFCVKKFSFSETLISSCQSFASIYPKTRLCDPIN